jgi:hypothetical protein
MLLFRLQVRFVTEGSCIATFLSAERERQLRFRSRSTATGGLGGEQTLERSPHDQTDCPLLADSVEKVGHGLLGRKVRA